ncbi:hypothetical protein EDB89DRAFT_1906896 [Lactarius sanguifluus]|nr:hypothetical protein EDB89DRAFT_1906896 [Lactarius sanguifluus]
MHFASVFSRSEHCQHWHETHPLRLSAEEEEDKCEMKLRLLGTYSLERRGDRNVPEQFLQAARWREYRGDTGYFVDFASGPTRYRAVEFNFDNVCWTEVTWNPIDNRWDTLNVLESVGWLKRKGGKRKSPSPRLDETRVRARWNEIAFPDHGNEVKPERVRNDRYTHGFGRKGGRRDKGRGKWTRRVAHENEEVGSGESVWKVGNNKREGSRRARDDCTKLNEAGEETKRQAEQARVDLEVGEEERDENGKSGALILRPDLEETLKSHKEKRANESKTGESTIR